MGQLTTHVLDTVQGKPGAGMRVELSRLSNCHRTIIKAYKTNANGRSDHPLLQGEEFVRGEYELAFEVADYFRRAGIGLASPPFLDLVVIRFGVANPAEHYHVPLLVTPWSYSTYRGS